jgi:ADP-ribosylglycohydrolase
VRGPKAIETTAQERWVAAGQAAPLPPPARDRAASRDRAMGALLGLAVGDAVGAAIEFAPKPRHALLDDMRTGGPHRLQRGQWTDDTAMALALADSLVHAPALDPADLMRRFVDWHETGSYSCTGRCFDIGNATRAALDRFRRSGDPMAGSTEEAASGNGALMRLAPVAIRHWRDREEMGRVAQVQTRTTHGSPATMATACGFAKLLARAIAGEALPEILASPAAGAIQGGWRGMHRDAIEGSGYVARSLQAATWAVSRSTDFRSAVLLAANLGDDADTTAAIAGQLAGAVYGVSGIPEEWLGALAWRERIAAAAGSLFEASWPEGVGGRP